MRAWEIPVETTDDLARFVRALSKNRYVREVDHRIHVAVDRALGGSVELAGVDPASRDPRLWRSATLDELADVFRAFWSDPGRDARADRLRQELAALGLGVPGHAPFEIEPDASPHPELVVLDWTLHPVEDLDVDQHAGALGAMEDDGEEVHPSEPLYVEGPYLTPPELLVSYADGGVPGTFLVWCDGPYAYADYVLRGAAKVAKLVDRPIGLRDFEVP